MLTKNQQVGVNTLKSMLPELSRKSGNGMHYTNHSLRATSITRMFNNGLPEKVLAETSGHKSVKALQSYEHSSSVQKHAVTASVNVVAQDTNLVTENKVAKAASMISSSKETAQSFSANFTNCTINFSLSN